MMGEHGATEAGGGSPMGTCYGRAGSSSTWERPTTRRRHRRMSTIHDGRACELGTGRQAAGQTLGRGAWGERADNGQTTWSIHGAWSLALGCSSDRGRGAGVVMLWALEQRWDGDATMCAGVLRGCRWWFAVTNVRRRRSEVLLGSTARKVLSGLWREMPCHMIRAPWPSARRHGHGHTKG
jgi:hypothetical protein